MVEEQKPGLIPRGSLRTLVIAVLLGVVGIALMNFYFRSRTKKVQWVSVAVATKPFTGGDTIRSGWLVAKELPRDVIGGKFVEGKDIIAVTGRVVGVDMDPGQPLYWNAIPLAAQGGYDKYLRPELRERAFALKLEGVLSSGTRAGDVIDIVGTYSEGGSGGRTAFEVLPAVTVIDKIGSVLVLSVTPEEQLLLLAAQPCNLTMSIRSKLEPNEDVKMTPVSIGEVLPRARALGTARTVRLAKEAADGKIQRD
jgi:Flp pilus assembly protein CpaB